MQKNSTKAQMLLAKTDGMGYNHYINWVKSSFGERGTDRKGPVMYQIGDKIAHPLHGAGTISEIERKRIDGQYKSYYVMQIAKVGMRVMIPTESCDAVGIRPIVCREEADRIFSCIPQLEVVVDNNWNKRCRDNMERIKSGDLLEVAAVIKSLVYRDNERGLSTGERKMLHNAKQILISEMVLSKGESYESIEAQLYACLA